MPKPMLLDEMATWPRDVRAFLARHEEILRDHARLKREADADREQATASLDSAWHYECRMWINPLSGRRDAVLAELLDLVAATDLVAYQCARLTDGEVASVRRDGVRPLSPKLVADRVEAAVEDGLLSADQGAQLIAENCATHGGRAGMAWFVLTRPPLADEMAVRRLFSSWGGEAVYWSREDGPAWDVLRQIGRPAILRVRLQVGSLEFGDVPGYMVARLLDPAVSHSRSACCGDGCVRAGVGPERVLDVVQLGDAQFEALTRCSTWDSRIR